MTNPLHHLLTRANSLPDAWTVIAQAVLLPRHDEPREWWPEPMAPFGPTEAVKLDAAGHIWLMQRRVPHENRIELVVRRRRVKPR